MDHDFKEAEALARLANNKDLLLKISAYFVVYAERQITDLRDAFISDDTKKLFYLTHKLVGSLANFGRTEALAAGHRLQAALKHPDALPDGAAAKEKITVAYQEFVRAVEQLRTELAAYSIGVTPPDMTIES